MPDLQLHLLARTCHQDAAVLQRFNQADDATDVIDARLSAAFIEMVSDHGAITVTGKQFQQKPAIDSLIDQMHSFHLCPNSLYSHLQQIFQIIGDVRLLQ